MLYTYETLDGKQTFELNHPMASPALTQHPDTGVPIRRIITSVPNLKFAKKLDASQMARFDDYKDSNIYKETRKKPVSRHGVKKAARKAKAKS